MEGRSPPSFWVAFSSRSMARDIDAPRTPFEERDTSFRAWVACSVHASILIGWGAVGLEAPWSPYALVKGNIAILIQQRGSRVPGQYHEMVFAPGKGGVDYVQQIEGLYEHQAGYSEVVRVNAK